MKTFLKIAGVQFDNEDGESRQEILKTLKKNTCGIITVDLVETTYEGEYAIKCLDHNSRKIIGWIPKTELKNEILSSQMTGFIRVGSYGASVQLAVIKRPTQAQYHAVKIICSRARKSMPAYDTRAYAYIFEMARA